jgi:hypothetical protein
MEEASRISWAGTKKELTEGTVSHMQIANRGSLAQGSGDQAELGQAALQLKGCYAGEEGGEFLSRRCSFLKRRKVNDANNNPVNVSCTTIKAAPATAIQMALPRD